MGTQPTRQATPRQKTRGGFARLLRRAGMALVAALLLFVGLSAVGSPNADAAAKVDLSGLKKVDSAELAKATTSTDTLAAFAKKCDAAGGYFAVSSGNTNNSAVKTAIANYQAAKMVGQIPGGACVWKPADISQGQCKGNGSSWSTVTDPGYCFANVVTSALLDSQGQDGANSQTVKNSNANANNATGKNAQTYAEDNLDKTTVSSLQAKVCAGLSDVSPDNDPSLHPSPLATCKTAVKTAYDGCASDQNLADKNGGTSNVAGYSASLGQCVGDKLTAAGLTKAQTSGLGDIIAKSRGAAATAGQGSCAKGDSSAANLAKCTSSLDCNSADAQANWDDSTKKCAVPSPAASAGAVSTCNIPGVGGWIVCPALTFLAGLADDAYGVVQNLLLVDDSAGLKNITDSYGNFQTMANLVLAITFLVIIYSEATGGGFGGLSNYNIKKMLPRLVIFAILVNISGYLCIAAIDLSNIVGTSAAGFVQKQADKNYDVENLQTNDWATKAANAEAHPKTGKADGGDQ